MVRDRTPPALPWWNYLEELRLRNGWSRTQFAVRAGVARSTIDKWKSAPRAPLNTTITEVAARLGIDVELALQLAGIVPGPLSAGDDDETSRRLATDVEHARHQVMEAIDREPELAVLIAELIARSRGRGGEHPAPSSDIQDISRRAGGGAA